MVGLILKVFALSALLAIAIKYGGPFLPISATDSVALVAVCLPTVLMAIVLGWRWQHPPQ